MEVMLYSRPGCHLCEEAKQVLIPLLEEFGLTLCEINVDTDKKLTARYGEELPVVLLDGRKVAKYRVEAKSFRRLLERSRKA